MSDLKIGIIGLDTSHVPAFTSLLNDTDVPFHVPGGKVTAAFPGGSPDFEKSAGRVDGFTATLRDQWGVRILDTPAAVAQECDAILLTSADGRVHRAQFEAIAPFGKPVFVDKPFATTLTDAERIVEVANRHSVPLMTCSSLRYYPNLQEALASTSPLTGFDAFGPMSLEPTQPGLFWYGIHTVEMLYAAFGRGCAELNAVTTEQYEFVTARWQDGRIGTVRGNRDGNTTFGALLHTPTASRHVDASAGSKPGYAGLLEAVLPFFRTGHSPVSIEDSLEIVAFIEAANRSRATGESVQLNA